MIFQIQRFIEKKILPYSCLLFSYLKFFYKSPSSFDPKKIKKVAFVRFWALGESILVLPTIKALKDSNPDLEITVICTNRNEAVFQNQPFIDHLDVVSGLKLIPYCFFGFIGLRWLKKFDVVIDAEPHFAISSLVSFFISKKSIGYNHGNRSKLYDLIVPYNDSIHTVNTIASLISPLGVFPKPSSLTKLIYSKSDLDSLNSSLSKIGVSLSKPFITIHAFCGPTATTRAWPLDRFAALIDLILASYDVQIILTGSSNEESKITQLLSKLKSSKNVFVLTHLSSGGLFALLEKSSLMVSNDTGPMHASAAMGTYTIGLFGPETPLRYGPFPKERNFAFYKAKHPPVINVHLNQFSSPLCDGECLREITVGEVFSAVKSRLDSLSK